MLRTLIAVVLCGWSPALAVERGPHPQSVDGTAATLVWRGADATAVTLIGPQGARKKLVLPPDASGRVRVRFDALSPGVAYHYRVDAGEQTFAGDFHTPPESGRPFTFAAYGDSRTDHRVHAALAKRIASADPDVVLHTGDLVTRGHRDDEWAAFFEASRPIWSRAVLMPVVGNHDLDGGRADTMAAHFEQPGTYYAFTWGNVRFVAIDSEVAAVGDAPDTRQRAWLIETITAAERDPAIDHVVGFVHKGPFSGHPRREGNTGLRAQLPDLIAAGLDLIVSGHDHIYERGRSDDGLAYMVLGAGGAPLYETVGPGVRDGHRAEVSRPIYSFARFRVDGPRLQGCGVDLSGVPFDCFTLAPR